MQMTDSMLAETLRDRLPRLLAAGADYNDIQAILRRIDTIDAWPAAWEEVAEGRVALGEAALAEGRLLSGGAALQAAALHYHFAQFVLFEDRAEKARLQALQAEFYLRAAPYLLPPAERLTVSFGEGGFEGNLRLPATGSAPFACVMLNPGADSTKEEFHTLENEFLARCLATFSYDGPGQGRTWARMKLRPDFEAPIGAVIDRLQAHPAIDPGRIGIWGRSLGAYCALRGATDPRMRACVSIGGFYDLGEVWSRMPKGTTDSLAFAFDVADPAEEARRYTLRGVLPGVECPVLIVHSGGDNVCPVAESQRMVDELPGAELRVYAEGNHVCDNIPYKVRPLMADWLAGALGVRA
jgi:2,6-dihydroxypseudooxynicotine hydrolase